MSSTVSQILNKTFGKYGLSDHKVIFMWFVFTSALVAFNISHKSFKWDYWKKAIFTPATLFGGITLGAANSLSSLFQLKALEVLPASVVYPGFAAGNLLVVFLVGKFIFHEPSNKRQLYAIGLLTVALIVVNL